MKRFKNEGEICVLIDKYKMQILSMHGAAESKDHLADMLRTTEESKRIPEIRAEAEHIRTQAKWMEGRIATLGEKLSEIRTPQLPGADNGDTTVPTA